MFMLYLRAIRAGRCRERRYADHIFIQIYFRMHHIVVKFSKFSSPQAARGIDPPNQNPADIPDPKYSSVQFSSIQCSLDEFMRYQRTLTRKGLIDSITATMTPAFCTSLHTGLI